MKGQHSSVLATLVLAVTLASPLVACDDDSEIPLTDAGTRVSTYQRIDLVSDRRGEGRVEDRNLINPWGIAFGANTPFWVANNGTGTATVYSGTGAPQPAGQPLVVQLPKPAGSTSTGPTTPTGLAYYGGSGFEITQGASTAPSRFLFATEEGTILGWSEDVDADSAVIALDNSSSGAVYKGLAVARRGDDDFLYAANFRTGSVQVYDSDFRPARELDELAFVDPSLPRGYAPFGIHNINGSLYVAFAQQDESQEDDLPGEGKGFVTQFDANGRLLARIASGGPLNAPWAVVLAPNSFGDFSNTLLIGNFGDGRINAYRTDTRELLGQLRDRDGEVLSIEGLWDLKFGNGRSAGDVNTLYFSAGVDDEQHGVFGQLTLAR